MALPDSAVKRGPVTLTRDGEGRLYLGLRDRGVVVYPRGDSTGASLRDRRGRVVRSVGLSWVGDTLAVEEWRSWHLFTAGGRYVGCRPFEDAGNEFATQVFPLRPLAGGLAVGELLPPWSGMGIGEALVVSRGQEVVRTLARRAPRPDRVEVPFPWGGGSWQVAPPLLTRTLWSASDRDAGVVVVEQQMPTRPGPTPVHVARLGFAGDTLHRTTLLVPALEVSEGFRTRMLHDRAAAGVLGSTIERDAQAVREAFRRTVPFPPYHPPVTQVLAGGDGSAWLRLATEGDTAVWVRLDPWGREQGRLRLEEGFVALHADADGLRGIRRGPRGGYELVQYSAEAPTSGLRLQPGPVTREDGPIVLGPPCSGGDEPK